MVGEQVRFYLDDLYIKESWETRDYNICGKLLASKQSLKKPNKESF